MRWQKKKVGNAVGSKTAESQNSFQHLTNGANNVSLTVTFCSSTHTGQRTMDFFILLNTCTQCDEWYAAALDSWMGGCLKIDKAKNFTHLC